MGLVVEKLYHAQELHGESMRRLCEIWTNRQVKMSMDSMRVEWGINWSGRNSGWKSKEFLIICKVLEGSGRAFQCG